MNPILAGWSWQEIQKVYAVFGRQLKEYQHVADRLSMKLPVILGPGSVLPFDSDPQRAEFVGRWYLDVNRINLQLSVLDAEIARRNNLIGVMG